MSATAPTRSVYILYMGPAEADKEWHDSGIEGVARLLDRLWRLGLETAALDPSGAVPDGELVRAAHRTIARVSDDLQRRFQFHTPIAALFELVNEIYRVKEQPGQEAAVRFATETAVSLVQPYAPHIAEELWERLGRSRLWEESWPEADPALLAENTFELVVQVNGASATGSRSRPGCPTTSWWSRRRACRGCRRRWTASRSAGRSSFPASS